MRFCLVIFLVNLSVRVFADVEHPRGRVEAYTTDSSKYTGRILRAVGGVTVNTDHDVEFAYEDLARTYPGDLQVRDSYAAVTTISRWAPRFYTEGYLSESSTNDIYAIWSARVAAHAIAGSGDAGLAFKYDEFRKSIAGTINPSYFYSFSDELGVGGAIFAVRTDVLSVAYQLQAVRRFWERHTVRVVGAIGRTIEDAGLVAAFSSVTTQYAIDVNTHWRAGVQLIDYWSTVRNEKSFGLTVEFR